MGAPYPKEPVVLVFKTSNRSNAKTKMKVYKTRNIDEIIDGLEEGNLPGVPKRAEVLELALGNSFTKKYKRRYNL